MYYRCNNRQAVLQGLNEYYEEVYVDGLYAEEDGFLAYYGNETKDDEEEYIENPYWMTHWKGSDGFYYEGEDYDEQCPISGALASFRDNLFSDDWGTPISVVNEWYGLRYCHSYMEAELIQKQYELAIGRTSSYRGNVYNHVLNRFGIVWEPIKRNYLVGQERFGVFCVSHFAPSSIRKGMEMMREVLHSSMPVCIATLPYQANMLRKIGFNEVGKVPQWFAGELHLKTVMVNDAIDIYSVQRLLDSISEYIN